MSESSQPRRSPQQVSPPAVDVAAPVDVAASAFAEPSVANWPKLSIGTPLPPPVPTAPYDALPTLQSGQFEALSVACERANDAYLIDFVEEYGFCPFSRKGRRLGQVHRYVYHADTVDVTPLLERMRAIAADPAQAVVQIVFPMMDVEPRAWVRFVQDLTTYGNHLLPQGDRLGSAALHPMLAYSDHNAFALIPLFRRAPDPTIQWVRLDVVRALYAGREGGSRFVDFDDIDALLAAPMRTPLYDRIAHTNAAMARRLRIAAIEGWLTQMHVDARRSYEAVLFSDRWDDAAP